MCISPAAIARSRIPPGEAAVAWQHLQAERDGCGYRHVAEQRVVLEDEAYAAFSRRHAMRLASVDGDVAVATQSISPISTIEETPLLLSVRNVAQLVGVRKKRTLSTHRRWRLCARLVDTVMQVHRHDLLVLMVETLRRR
jgi:hypothetical protein